MKLDWLTAKGWIVPATLAIVVFSLFTWSMIWVNNKDQAFRRQHTTLVQGHVLTKGEAESFSTDGALIGYIATGTGTGALWGGMLLSDCKVPILLQGSDKPIVLSSPTSKCKLAPGQAVTLERFAAGETVEYSWHE